MNPLTWTLPVWYVVAAFLGFARIGWGWRERIPELIIRMTSFLIALAVAYPSAGTSGHPGGTVVAWKDSPVHIIASVIALLVLVKFRHPRKRWGSRSKV